MKRWYCVHVKPSREIAAADEIKALGFPTFVPLFTVYERQGSRQIPAGEKPLFPRYIFTIFDEAAKTYGAINRGRTVSMQGILRDIDGKPCAVPYKIMRALRIRHQRRDKGPQPIALPFTKGQKVRVIHGPFSGFDAMFGGPDGQRVTAFLTIFGRETKLSLALDDLKAAV